MFMRRLAVSLFAAVASVALVGISSVQADALKSGDFVGVTGDSITEQKAYSVDMETYFLVCRAGGPVRVGQFGWGGDSMGWLWGRGGQNDIVAMHPTVITTCYGMNDGGYRAPDPAVIKTYRDGMDRLVKFFKSNGVRLVVVGSPGVVDTDTFRSGPKESGTYNETLAALRDAARDVAKENDCTFANVHDAMMDAMNKAKAKYGAKYHVAGGDGVHPAANGQLVMAYAFLKALGCDGEIGTITLDLAGGNATASEGHKVLSAQNGAVELESSRYPFCFWGNPSDPNATAGMIEFIPFNQDLNRFQLVVKNAPGERVRVTWGETSKEFASADLAKGINLAAEFLQNPFSAQFTQVREAVRRKQEHETTLYKVALGGLPNMAKQVQDIDPEATGAVNRILAAMMKKDAAMAEDIKKLVTPVKHSIRVEAVK